VLPSYLDTFSAPTVDKSDFKASQLQTQAKVQVSEIVAGSATSTTALNAPLYY
jgi:hypothetical protein